jgi:SsrA-binding protein
MIIRNKKAYYNYHILETLQAGISLQGQEVKSIKKQQVSLDGSFVRIKNSEAILYNLTVQPYQPNNIYKKYIPDRPKKLLLTKKEINFLIGKLNQKGLTAIPVSIYVHKGLIKIDIAVVKPKSQVDKRAIIKKRDQEREMKQFH